MKKYMLYFLIAVVFETVFGCAIAPPVISKRDTGWISDDVFRVRAVGAAKYPIADHAVRKQQALQAALLMAHFIVFEELTATILIDVKNVPHREILAIVKSSFSSYVREGRVIEAKYDADGNCAILLEIQGDGIKQKFFALRNQLLVKNR